MIIALFSSFSLALSFRNNLGVSHSRSAVFWSDAPRASDLLVNLSTGSFFGNQCSVCEPRFDRHMRITTIMESINVGPCWLCQRYVTFCKSTAAMKSSFPEYLFFLQEFMMQPTSPQPHASLRHISQFSLSHSHSGNKIAGLVDFITIL